LLDFGLRKTARWLGLSMGFWQRLVYGRKNRFSEAEARSYIEMILRDRRGLFSGAYRLERFSDGTDQGVYRPGI